MDGSGNLYIADFRNNRVRKVDLLGIISTVAGSGTRGRWDGTQMVAGDGGPATSASTGNPFSVFVDDGGNLFIATSGQVRKVGPSGIISTVAGRGISAPAGDGGPATEAGLDSPFGVCADVAGNVYISENYRPDNSGPPLGRIRVVAASKQSSTQPPPAGVPSALTSDFDGNGVVDFDDFFAFAAAFGKKQGEAGFDARFDLSKNGEVDFDDFFMFAADFGKTAKSGKAAASRPGVNDRASLSVGTIASDDGLTARIGVSNVAQMRGFSMVVSYDPSALAFVRAERASDALISRGGPTPLFLVQESQPGQVVLADVIADGGTASGDGALANLIFRRAGPGGDAAVRVDLAQVFDGAGGMNLLDGTAENLPLTYALSQNYPNPFNPATQIAYELPERADVRLVVYNILGQQVKTLVQGRQEAGYYRVAWDGRDAAGRQVSSGLYFYRLTSGGVAETRKMMLLK